MNKLFLRRTFALFHFTLAAVIFFESINTALQAHAPHRFGAMSSHIAVLAALEAIAALLFLFPWTLKVGGTLLLLIFGVAVLIHGIQKELPLLVYAVAVFFVMVHGNVFSKDLFRLGKAAI